MYMHANFYNFFLVWTPPKSIITEHTKNLIVANRQCLPIVVLYCQNPDLGLRLEVDFLAQEEEQQQQKQDSYLNPPEGRLRDLET